MTSPTYEVPKDLSNPHLTTILIISCLMTLAIFSSTASVSIFKLKSDHVTAVIKPQEFPRDPRIIIELL